MVSGKENCKPHRKKLVARRAPAVPSQSGGSSFPIPLRIASLRATSHGRPHAPCSHKQLPSNKLWGYSNRKRGRPPCCLANDPRHPPDK